MRLLLGAPSAILRFHTFLLRLLHRLPFFRSHRRFLLDLFIRFAFLGHTVRPVSVPLRPIVQRNDEWPLRVDSRPIKLDLATPRRMSANGHLRMLKIGTEPLLWRTQRRIGTTRSKPNYVCIKPFHRSPNGLLRKDRIGELYSQ